MNKDEINKFVTTLDEEPILIQECSKAVTTELSISNHKLFSIKLNNVLNNIDARLLPTHTIGPYYTNIEEKEYKDIDIDPSSLLF